MIIGNSSYFLKALNNSFILPAVSNLLSILLIPNKKTAIFSGLD